MNFQRSFRVHMRSASRLLRKWQPMQLHCSFKIIKLTSLTHLGFSIHIIKMNSDVAHTSAIRKSLNSSFIFKHAIFCQVAIADNCLRIFTITPHLNFFCIYHCVASV